MTPQRARGLFQSESTTKSCCFSQEKYFTKKFLRNFLENLGGDDPQERKKLYMWEPKYFFVTLVL
jgi:hypothetical protein